MEFYIILLISLCLCLLLKPLITLLLPSSKPTINLPPGPSKFALLSKFLVGRRSFYELGPIVSSLRKKYGQLITVHLGSQPTIFITNNVLAHQALIQNGAVFADRPPSINSLIVSNSKKIISKSPYGPVWRALRRNLTSGVLHPAQLRSFSRIRKRVLNNLIHGLQNESNLKKDVYVEDHFRHAVFSLLILLCCGESGTDKLILDVENAQIRLFKSFPRFMIFIMMPRLGKLLFKKLWKELNEIVTGFDVAIVPLIEMRKQELQQSSRNDGEQQHSFYVDTLLNLQVPGEEENISEADVLGLCNEFIAAGTDTTMLSLEWIMANLVKYPLIQSKILDEIKQVIGENDFKEDTIKEEDLQKMTYLKAVILEGLRRHPPGYALATPHSVTEDVQLGGYTVPKGTAANFLIADMGRDPNIWEDPMEFKPERFLKQVDYDVTGTREIKMMPFGAGRRVCPGYGLAMLHLEYLVANLVWHFEWKSVDGEEVDLTEKHGITLSMKNPLRVHLSPRF
ncbi:cytochrome P450 89A2-like [Mercurialis annua]|uniref:cytochrome P450 89A2-like n=1 Tax=Mercurialis annua TaxID=3986 RepID=UPI00215E4110|nr:cytochrome P450 89A2-like [Mercurialis annua]